MLDFSQVGKEVGMRAVVEVERRGVRVEVESGLYRHYQGGLVEVFGEGGMADISYDAGMDGYVSYRMVDGGDSGRVYVEKVSSFLEVVPGSGGVRFFEKSGVDWGSQYSSGGRYAEIREMWGALGFGGLEDGLEWLIERRDGMGGYYHGMWEVESMLRRVAEGGLKIGREQFLACCFNDLVHLGGASGWVVKFDQGGVVNGLVFRQANARWGWVSREEEERVVGILEGVGMLRQESVVGVGYKLDGFKGGEGVGAMSRLVADLVHEKWSGDDFLVWEELLYLEMRHLLGYGRIAEAEVRREFDTMRLSYAMKLMVKPLYREMSDWEVKARRNVEGLRRAWNAKYKGGG